MRVGAGAGAGVGVGVHDVDLDDDADGYASKELERDACRTTMIMHMYRWYPCTCMGAYALHALHAHALDHSLALCLLTDSLTH